MWVGRLPYIIIIHSPNHNLFLLLTEYKYKTFKEYVVHYLLFRPHARPAGAPGYPGITRKEYRGLEPKTSTVYEYTFRTCKLFTRGVEESRVSSQRKWGTRCRQLSRSGACTKWAAAPLRLLMCPSIIYFRLAHNTSLQTSIAPHLIRRLARKVP